MINSEDTMEFMTQKPTRKEIHVQICVYAEQINRKKERQDKTLHQAAQEAYQQEHCI